MGTIAVRLFETSRRVMLRPRNVQPTLPTIEWIHRTSSSDGEVYPEEGSDVEIQPAESTARVEIHANRQPLTVTGRDAKSRKYKSNLPVIIRNENWSKDEIRRRLAERQDIQRLNHDKRAMQPLAPLIPRQDVRVRDTQTDTWQPAKVISTDVQPRSYNVLTPTCNVLRRNRRHLRETTERHTFQQDNVDDTDDLTRRDDMQVVPPPCNSVLPQKKSVRFQLPQPEQYTSSGRRVKRPQRLDL